LITENDQQRVIGKIEFFIILIFLSKIFFPYNSNLTNMLYGIITK